MYYRKSLINMNGFLSLDKWQQAKGWEHQCRKQVDVGSTASIAGWHLHICIEFSLSMLAVGCDRQRGGAPHSHALMVAHWRPAYWLFVFECGIEGLLQVWSNFTFLSSFSTPLHIWPHFKPQQCHTTVPKQAIRFHVSMPCSKRCPPLASQQWSTCLSEASWYTTSWI